MFIPIALRAIPERVERGLTARPEIAAWIA